VPRGIGLNCDGMRRCQRLPEFTHPVDSARRIELHQTLYPRDLQNYSQNSQGPLDNRPMKVTP
jgi:hypothetical protein